MPSVPSNELQRSAYAENGDALAASNLELADLDHPEAPSQDGVRNMSPLNLLRRPLAVRQTQTHVPILFQGPAVSDVCAVQTGSSMR
jgi:hypothetical protein